MLCSPPLIFTGSYFPRFVTGGSKLFGTYAENFPIARETRLGPFLYQGSLNRPLLWPRIYLGKIILLKAAQVASSVTKKRWSEQSVAEALISQKMSVTHFNLPRLASES
jgi:hypothetical protein